MAYKYKAQPTKGQKVKKLLRKLTLSAIFGAAVAGVGANYYASNEELLVRIESVERSAAAPGEAPHLLIHTDKGTFVNEPTRMRLKDQADAAEIAQYIRPGETIRITVYGLNPQLGPYSRDDLHFFRNIIKIHPGPGQMIVVPQGTPIPGTDIPAGPTGTLTDNGIIEDQTAPEASALNSDFNAISKNTPQLARALKLMDQLPITGRPVYDMLKDPANRIESTLFPVPVGEGSLSTYSARKARIARGVGTSIAFHEWFHAYQDHIEGSNDMFTLTVKDAVIANFLDEAAAVAYEIAARKEAENRNLQFETPRQWCKPSRMAAAASAISRRPRAMPPI
ncbi:MAG TPA: hypothetical protein VEF76_02650 [Patescibacteria group bacterium]|nr:hypothetical protein [Patescibacteria group bacterium]